MECGDALDPDFHADHRRAWAHGGRTDVVNGQALCPICNRNKGDKQTVATASASKCEQAEGCDLAAGAATSDSPTRNPARFHEPAGVGHGGAHQCHKEKLS